LDSVAKPKRQCMVGLIGWVYLQGSASAVHAIVHSTSLIRIRTAERTSETHPSETKNRCHLSLQSSSPSKISPCGGRIPTRSNARIATTQKAAGLPFLRHISARMRTAGIIHRPRRLTVDWLQLSDWNGRQFLPRKVSNSLFGGKR
jgi:hypothetical protein